ncbi:MAG: hypothetical protein BGO44_05195 [Legionella sp. 39-23]|jgi:hypothetical protein|nr:MAG: hypothetical protein BGO44_05195 [Legionella sp. 39-23]
MISCLSEQSLAKHHLGAIFIHLSKKINFHILVLSGFFTITNGFGYIKNVVSLSAIKTRL